MNANSSRPIRPNERRPRAKRGSKSESREHQRSSVYRGLTRAAATAAYHADARVMARMGYVPESEEWSTELGQVLVVGYVHAPERTPAILEALANAEADPIAEPPPLPPEKRSARRMYGQLAPEAKLALGGLGGVVAGVAICFLVATVAGESPDTISLGIFGLIGLLIGSIAGITADYLS